MATTNNIITRNNFTGASWAGTYTISTGANSSTPEWFYVSAESFVFQVQCDYNAWAAARTVVTGYFYNGSSWTQIFYKNFVDGKNSESLKFYHNRNGEGANGTFNYRDSLDSQKAHLFRFRCEKNYGATESHVTCWYGGPGLLNTDEYNAYLRGKKIRFNGSLDNSSTTGFVWRGGRLDTPPDSTAISLYNPSNSYPTINTAAYEHHFIYNWFY